MRLAVVVAGLLVCGRGAWGQAPPATAGCGSEGYRVVARRWDALLARGWEVRRDCAHPEWPARTVAVSGMTRLSEVGVGAQAEADRARGLRTLLRETGLGETMLSGTVPDRPVLVRAGERVRLWSRGAVVRIEMSGVAESPAHEGERVVVRVTRETEDAGLAMQEIAGVVRGAGDVEMER
jgi:Chaperone for flagella basal body P-ring formation